MTVSQTLHRFACRVSLSPRTALGCLVLAAGLLLPAGSAFASGGLGSPAFTISSFASPTHFSEDDSVECAKSKESCDEYQAVITNAGAQATDGSEVIVKDQVPAGLEVLEVMMRSAGTNGFVSGFFSCSTAPVECNLNLPPGLAWEPDERVEMRVIVAVKPGASGLLHNKVSVAGGGAPKVAAEETNEISSAVPPFGLSAFGSLFAGVDGLPDSQAGAHPYEGYFTFALNNVLRPVPDGFGVDKISVEDPKDLAADLPVGMIGSVRSLPQCTLVELSSEQHCPTDTTVGHIFTKPNSLAAVQSPLWNLVPDRGTAAEFGYVDLLNANHVLYARLVPSPAGYVIETTSPDIPQIRLSHIYVDFFGVPAARNGSAAEGAKEIPFFSNPGDCSGQPLVTRAHADSWLHPGDANPDGSPNFSGGDWASASSESEPVSGCNQLQFHPTIEATPETNRADSPTGLDVNITVPQTESVETLATPPLRKAVVSLPTGMTVNPSTANGRAACSLAELGISASGQPDAAPPSCPDASKLGTLELTTPALKGTLEGQIYLARQTENPFGSLIALYLVVNDPTTGVVVKIPGEVRPDPNTGQLTATFDNNPQLPFSELKTHFFGGQKAALRTPAVCGKYKVSSTLTPWSAPESGPPAEPSASFEITQGCAQSAATEPHKPAFSAGTVTPTAAIYSPFALKLSREDGSQELSGLNLTLPEGLSGKLAGLSECSEAQIAQAIGRSKLGEGAIEQVSPSCPASSEVGTVTVGAGAGLTPYYATGHAYLAGPYKGAPLSLAVITPAVAGPFDLGTVVLRSALVVNPESAQITAVSDPIPHILYGIPLDIRSIALDMSRPQFTLNPTGCGKKAITGEALSVLGTSAALTNPFQVGGCKALKFAPKLSLRLKGSVKRTANPKLIATLTAKPGEANIARAQVKLPPSAFLDQGHIGTVCTRPDFAAHACPAGSVYGTALAKTPLLDQPLKGNVYLRANPAHKLPDLVADLNGQIEVALAGKTDSVKGALRNTFEAVPDAPVSSFRLELFGGKRGLIEMSSGFCQAPKAQVKLLAQSGKGYDAAPMVASSCKKPKKHKSTG